MTWTAVVIVYLVVALATAAMLFVMSSRLADANGPVGDRAALSATAGMLWPILLLGVVEVGWVALYAKTGEPGDDEPRIDVLV